MKQKQWIERQILDSLPAELAWAMANDWDEKHREFLLASGLYEQTSGRKWIEPTYLAHAIKEAIKERTGENEG